MFTTVKVLSPYVSSPNNQTTEVQASGALASVTVNMEKELGPNTKKGDSFKLQVNFMVDEAFELDKGSSGVLRPKNSRFEVVGESPIDVKGNRGKVVIAMSVRDLEGENVAALVQIGGSVNKATVSASLRIRIVTGMIELPKSQRDKP